jgi:hypothetical protein
LTDGVVVLVDIYECPCLPDDGQPWFIEAEPEVGLVAVREELPDDLEACSRLTLADFRDPAAGRGYDFAQGFQVLPQRSGGLSGLSIFQAFTAGRGGSASVAAFLMTEDGGIPIRACSSCGLSTSLRTAK